jgi:hypothetical protein
LSDGPIKTGNLRDQSVPVVRHHLGVTESLHLCGEGLRRCRQQPSSTKYERPRLADGRGDEAGACNVRASSKPLPIALARKAFADSPCPSAIDRAMTASLGCSPAVCGAWSAGYTPLPSFFEARTCTAHRLTQGPFSLYRLARSFGLEPRVSTSNDDRAHLLDPHSEVFLAMPKIDCCSRPEAEVVASRIYPPIQSGHKISRARPFSGARGARCRVAFIAGVY